VLVGAVGLALQNVFFKVAYRTGASATAIGLGRFTLGALALWVYVVARYSRGNFPVRLPLQSLLTLLLLGSVAYFL